MSKVSGPVTAWLMSSDDDFLVKNFEYFQRWEYWYDKVLSLRHAARTHY
jgi:hypothetical protein